MIKRVFITMLVLVSFILFSGMTEEGSALPSGLQLTPDTEERRETYPERYSLKLLEEEPKVMPIRCFDVREDGCVALGFDISDDRIICVYSPEGEFLYGYALSAPMSGDFYIFWDQELLCVFSVRSEVIAKLDRDGNCVALGSPVKTDAFYDLQEYFESPVKQIGDVTYRLENDWFIGSDFCRLKITDENGSESVFYDASKAHALSAMGMILLLVVSLAFGAWIVIQKIKEEQSQFRTDTTVHDHYTPKGDLME